MSTEPLKRMCIKHTVDESTTVRVITEWWEPGDPLAHGGREDTEILTDTPNGYVITQHVEVLRN